MKIIQILIILCMLFSCSSCTIQKNTARQEILNTIGEMVYESGNAGFTTGINAIVYFYGYHHRLPSLLERKQMQEIHKKQMEIISNKIKELA